MAAQNTPRRDLPEGTVTLLFTDIEGSTQLLRRLGARYAGVQARHRTLLRTAFEAAGGVEVDTQGDAFMVAFRSAADAAAAAIEAQRALAAEAWPDEARVPVRMGIHTGEPGRGPEGYVGIDVVRASRICAVAHGGQILLSQLTRDLLAEAGYETIDLGRHRLKDLTDQERLYQLLAEGLPESFPPPRTLGGASLPALHHRLVGRQSDLGHIHDLLARPDVRLVTITGPGGAGKSRLALEASAAAVLERPVHLVGLAPVSDPALMLAEVARAVGVREQPGRPLAESIADALRGTRTLLFLDNFEHLAAAAPDIAALLDLVPDLDVLTTSRAPLRLSGEYVAPLDPLPIEDATTLFVELAAARGVVLREEALPSVREICRRLDGLPLAIELVAARLVAFTPARVLQALDEGLALEMEGPVDLPERQRTLRATIAWSYGLLSEPQKELHGALGVFAGGCTLDDARAVAHAGSGFFRDLEALVAWSLVRSDVSDGDVRLSMLETVREDAVARLAEDGRLEELRRRHAERFLELARAAEHELAGTDQASWLDRLEYELDNLRVAFDWLLASGRVEDALRSIAGLDRFWRAHAHVSEARRWLSLSLALAGAAPAGVRAAGLRTAAQQAAAQSDWNAAAQLLEEAIELYREGDEGPDEVIALAYLSFVALRRDDHAEAAKRSKQSLVLARRVGDARATSFALMSLGDVCWVQGHHDQAIAHYEEAVELRRGLGDPLLVCDAIYNLGMAAFQGGDASRARDAFEEALAPARELGEAQHIAAAQFMLAELDLLEGEPASAAERARESLGLYQSFEDDRSSARCLVILAGSATAAASLEDAARLFGAAAALRDGQPADGFEQPILDECLPKLESALGKGALSRLMDDGRHLRTKAVAREVVSTAIEE